MSDAVMVVDTIFHPVMNEIVHNRNTAIKILKWGEVFSRFYMKTDGIIHNH